MHVLISKMLLRPALPLCSAVVCKLQGVSCFHNSTVYGTHYPDVAHVALFQLLWPTDMGKQIKQALAHTHSTQVRLLAVPAPYSSSSACMPFHASGKGPSRLFPPKDLQHTVA